jgi:hypothetical protein
VRTVKPGSKQVLWEGAVTGAPGAAAAGALLPRRSFGAGGCRGSDSVFAQAVYSADDSAYPQSDAVRRDGQRLPLMGDRAAKVHIREEVSR